MKNKIVEILSALTTSKNEILDSVLILDFTVVTACVVGKPDGLYVLVDTGLENSYDYIVKSIENKFGENNPPQAIILTHGHFDHVGSIKKLIEKYHVPVYAHPFELPYLTGQKDYPLGDPTVDDGMVAKLSPTFPHTSIDITSSLSPLPYDGTVPGLPEWKWLHTPGHTEGHVSLFREKDRVLIVGDALTTTKQESLLSILFKKEKISGPPKYLTPDFERAEESIKKIKALNPSLIIPSHGKPIQGEELTKHLDLLINHYSEIARPQNEHENRV